MKNQALYTVEFNDGTSFEGGTIFDTKWLNIPNKKIKRIFYRLPGGNFLCLKDYEKYFHMIEAVKDITGKDKGKVKLEYAYIMGKRGRVVTSYRIALFSQISCHHGDSRYRQGDITVREFNIDDDKIKKLNSKGWKG